MIEKVRRVDFAPDEWLGGTAKLSDAECGIYIRACALIYSRGGPITRSDLRSACKSRGFWFRRGLDSLLQLGKLIALDAEHLDQARCEVELARARRRIQAGLGGAKARWDEAPTHEENSSDDDINATSTRHQRDINATSIVHQTDQVSHEINEVPDALAMPSLTGNAKSKKYRYKNLTLGYAPRAQERALAPEAPPVPHSAEDKAAVDAVVATVLATINLPPTGLRNGVYDEPAYRQAITIHKRDAWLNNLAAFVGVAIDGIPAKMAAWEAIEQARTAGSRNATPPDIRRAIDELSRMRETSDVPPTEH